MKTIEIKAISQPNWKEGLAIVLLLYYVMKSGDTVINGAALLLVAILFFNFTFKLYLLVRYNLLSYGKKIVVQIDPLKRAGFFLVSNKGKERFTEITVKRIPWYDLYYVYFLHDGSPLASKPLLLNADEVALMELALELGTLGGRSSGN